MESASRRVAALGGHLGMEPTYASSEKKKYNKDVCPVTGYSLTKTWARLTDPRPIRVCITGAAGQLAYSLIFMIAKGNMFGSQTEVVLQLLDIPQAAQVLKGIEMELQDCAFPLLKDVIVTTEVKTAFSLVDVALLVGAFPRQKGVERKDLLKRNAAIFQEHGKALNDYASRHVKVLVVGNPANTNCLIAKRFAPDLPSENFSALTRLDHNRAIGQIANKLKVGAKDVHNVIIWGNHSSTQYPDVTFGYVNNYPAPNIKSSIRGLINNEDWVTKDFITTVQQRGAKVIEARKSSSAASAAFAIVCHIRDWLFGTPEGEMVSMAVLSDGSYNVPEGIIYSFPVTCKQGNWSIAQGLPLSELSRKMMVATANELLEEKNDAFALLEGKA